MTRTTQFAVVMFVSLCTGIACGQLPVASLNTISLTGGKPGSTIELTVSGGNLEEASQLVFSHPGIKATQKQVAPSEFEKPQGVANVFQVTISKDVPLGNYEVRVAGRFGVSNPRVFAVDSYEPIADNGANRSLEKAQEVKPGSVVAGIADASNRDIYKVQLSRGQRLLVDCFAQRIHSRLQATLVLLDADGRELQRSQGTIERDPVIDITATKDSAYYIQIRDVLYGGGAEHFYRLRFSNSAYVDYVLPPAVKAGAKQKVKIYGRNLPGGKPANNVLVNGQQLEWIEREVTAPATATFASQWPLPSRAAVVDQFVVPLGAGSFGARLGISRENVIVETESAKPQKVTLPAEIAGQFYPARDEDTYEFKAKKGEVFWFEVVSHRSGLDTDPIARIYKVGIDKDGKEQLTFVTENDDPGDRNGRIGSDFDTSTDDPLFKFTAAEDTTYRLQLIDQANYSRKDPRMTYRLVARKNRPDFRVLLFPKQIKVANANQVISHSVSVRPGGTSYLELRAERRDGMTGDITVSCENLPTGVTCKPAILKGTATTGYLILEATDAAKPGTSTIRLSASADIGGKKVTQQVRGTTVVWGTGNRTQTAASFSSTNDIVLAVTGDQHPTTVQIDTSKGIKTSRGGKLEYPIKLVRRDGFNEDVKLVATGLPKEIKPADLTIKKGTTDGKLVFNVTNTKAQVGLHRFYLRADTKFKIARNPVAVERAKQRQKTITETIKKLAENVKADTAAKDNATKQAAALAKANTDAGNKVKAAEAAAANAQKALDVAKKKHDSLPTEAKDDAAKAKQAEAKKGLDAATAESKAKADELTKAKTAAAEAKKKADTAKAAQTAAENKLKETQAKSKRATDLKKVVDKLVADTTKANARKDVNIAVFSRPLEVEIAAAPITIDALKDATVAQKGKLEIDIAFKRLYGFAEEVTVNATIPKGTTGVTVNTVKVAKDKNAAKLVITTTDKAKIGDLTLTINATGTFNKVGVTTSTPLKVKVEKAK